MESQTSSFQILNCVRQPKRNWLYLPANIYRVYSTFVVRPATSSFPLFKDRTSEQCLSGRPIARTTSVRLRLCRERSPPLAPQQPGKKEVGTKLQYSLRVMAEIPNAFCCPIDLDIMSDPVFLIAVTPQFSRFYVGNCGGTVKLML